MALDIRSPRPLAGKRILITGGSSGFGLAAALAFLKEGAKVATCARHERDLEPVRKAGALAAAADVSREGDVERLLRLVEKELGGLDALINNAAVLETGSLRDLSPEIWRRTLDVNLTGAWLAAKGAAALMREGEIVNVTSGLSRFPMRPYNAYCVSKAGLDMLTRALAEELAPHVRVNAVDPGVAKTRMNPTAPHPPESVVPILRALVAQGPGGPTGRCFKKSGEEASW